MTTPPRVVGARGWRAAATLVVIVFAAAGCQSAQPTPTQQPTGSPMETPIEPLEPVDPRLAAPLRELAAHPDWTGVARPPFDVTKVRASIRELCVEATADGSPPLAVSIDVAGPAWAVRGVGTLDETTGEPVTFHERAPGEDAELCRMVLLDSPEPWPSDPGRISVSGGFPDAAAVPAIQLALLENPGAFGVEPAGLPSLFVSPVVPCAAGSCEPGLEPAAGLVCLDAVVYFGGPVSAVVLGLRQEAGGWSVESVRIAEQALARIPRPAPGGC